MSWLKHLPVGKPLLYVNGMFILETLKAFNGNRSQASRALDISPKTLRRRLATLIHYYPEYEIPPPLLGYEHYNKLRKSIAP